MNDTQQQHNQNHQTHQQPSSNNGPPPLTGVGGLTLEPIYHHNHQHQNGGQYKDHHQQHNYNASPTSTTHLTDLTNPPPEPHLTLLKNATLTNSSSWMPDPTSSSLQDSSLLPRLNSDFMEMRYIQLSDWDLNGYTAEGLSARLIDSRSLNDSPDNIIQYRPWEKPELSNSITSTTTTSPNGNIQQQIIPNGKSPPILTTLTSAFPTFSDTFGVVQGLGQGQGMNGGHKLPSFQSQFQISSYEQQHNGQNSQHSPAVTTTTTSAGVTTSPNPSLPSFHTLPATHNNNNTRGSYIHQGPPPHLVATTNPHPQFFDDHRQQHIQIFPGGQLITTTTTTQHHNHQNGGHPHPHHFINGQAQTAHHFQTANGGINGPPQQFLELVPVVPSNGAAAMHLHHGHYHPVTNIHPQQLHPKLSTDGNLSLPSSQIQVPGLTLNDLHHHSQQSNNQVNLNKQQYIQQQPMEGTLIVKLHQGQQQNYDQQHYIQHQQQQQLTPPPPPTKPANSSSSPQITSQTPLKPTTKKPPKRPKKNSATSNLNNGLHENSLDQNYPYNNNNNNNNNDLSNNSIINDPQVSSVSSSDSNNEFSKRVNNGGGLGQANGHLSDHSNHHLTNGHHNHSNGISSDLLDKPVKKKRKRCGECTGCQRKDNCGDCAPCRNEKSHQICKVRRCEKLTEKKSRAGRGGTQIVK